MKRALIVEDESAIQEILSEILKSECHFDEIIVASDGLEGYLHAMTQKFDLICLDHMMPYFKGADLLTAVREKDGQNKETTIIMVSAYLPQVGQSVKELDNSFFLEKPIDFTRFVRYVKMAGKT